MNIFSMARSLFSAPKTPIKDRVRYWCYDCYQIHETMMDHVEHWNDFVIKCETCKGHETLIIAINGKSNVSD